MPSLAPVLIGVATDGDVVGVKGRVIYRRTTASDVIQQLPPHPAARRDHVLSSLDIGNGRLFIFGGVSYRDAGPAFALDGAIYDPSDPTDAEWSVPRGTPCHASDLQIESSTLERSVLTITVSSSRPCVLDGAPVPVAGRIGRDGPGGPAGGFVHVSPRWNVSTGQVFVRQGGRPQLVDGTHFAAATIQPEPCLIDRARSSLDAVYLLTADLQQSRRVGDPNAPPELTGTELVIATAGWSPACGSVSEWGP
jgi:hypothetical protein